MSLNAKLKWSDLIKKKPIKYGIQKTLLALRMEIETDSQKQTAYI